MAFIRILAVAVVAAVLLDWGWTAAFPTNCCTESATKTTTSLPPSPVAREQTAPPPITSRSSEPTTETTVSEMSSAQQSRQSMSLSMPSGPAAAISDAASLGLEQLDAAQSSLPQGGSGVQGFIFRLSHGVIEEARVFLRHVKQKWVGSDGNLNMNAVLQPPAGRKKLPSHPPATFRTDPPR